MSEKDSENELYTLKCDIHKKEAMKYYCQTHVQLHCSMCTRENHQTCQVLSLDDITDGVMASKENKVLKEALSCLLVAVQEIRKSALQNKIKIEEQSYNALEKIGKQRQLINTFFDYIERNALAEVKTIEDEDMETLDTILQQCAAMENNFENVKYNLDDLEEIEQESKLFKKYKEEQRPLKVHQDRLIEIQTKNKARQYDYVTSDFVQQMMETKHRKLGDLVLGDNFSGNC